VRWPPVEDSPRTVRCRRNSGSAAAIYSTHTHHHLSPIHTAVAMGWARWAKSGGPEFQAKHSLLYGRLVRVGETCNRFADFGL